MENKKFTDLNIKPEILKSIADAGYETPTEIQIQTIPHIIAGKDIIAQAPTGTGKTCAFAVPILNNIDKDNQDIQALILCPTRELAIQIYEEFKKLTKYSSGVSALPIYGGQPISRQIMGLKKHPQIIIGTPGRVMDHLERRTLKIMNLKIIVLDEADEMLDMGFREDIDSILKSTYKERQTVLFSATMSKEIILISKKYQKEPISFKVQLGDNDLPKINQFYVKLRDSEKLSALITLIKDNDYKLVLVFCRTKRKTKEVNHKLREQGLNAEALHGDLKQSARDRTMKMFRSGQVNILVATDVAARGIDVNNIEAVFNFDAPENVEYYIHRIGRTSRANRVGTSYTFVSDRQISEISRFEKATKSKIEPLKTDYTLSPNYKPIAISTTSERTSRSSYDRGGDRGDRGGERSFDRKPRSFDHQRKPYEKNGDYAPRSFERSSDRPQRSFGAPSDGSRYFINLGSRDNANRENLTEFICKSTGLNSQDIKDVKLLDNYGFVEIDKEKTTAMDAMNGLKFNERTVNIEKAAPRKPRSEGFSSNRGGDRGGDRGGFKKSYSKDGFKKPYNKDGFKKSNSSYRSYSK